MMEELPEDRADSLIMPAEDRHDLVRAVEAALFASGEPLTPQQLSAHLGGARVMARWSSLSRTMPGAGSNSSSAAAAGISRRRPIWPTCCAGARGCAPPVAGRDRGLGDHRLSRTGQPRRDRGDPGRADIARHAGRADGSGLDARRRPARGAGRPTIYATTPGFLAHFGLESRRDLPGIDELRAAGLLDPVDDVFAALTGHDDEDQADAEPAFSDVEDESLRPD
jgi:segregation and condensation protein B